MPEQSGTPPEPVVLIHGLFMPGWDLSLLAQRLANTGFVPHLFQYASVATRPRDNARALSSFVSRIAGPTVHLVGHSLGGIVIRHLFDLFPEQRPGRIVTLGTPHVGSAAATALARYRIGQRLLGASVHAGLIGDLPPWNDARDLGVIAGDSSVGLGRFVAQFDSANDGTVAVAETRLPNARDHLVLPVSHLGMLVSATVAQETAWFLRHGRFARTRACAGPTRGGLC